MTIPAQQSVPLVSVVIPAYNAEDRLPLCIRALAGQEDPPGSMEILVVDDGSTDGTARAARETGCEQLRVISPGARGGPAAARNAGIEAARGELVLFTDSDCIPDRRFVAEICRPLMDDPAVGGVKGVYRTIQGSLAARFAQAEFEERYRMMSRLDSIDFVDTYAAAFRGSVLEQAGGFDCSYPVPNNEDVDLSFRIAAAGHRMVFAPAAVVEHRHRPTLAGYLRLKVSRGFWRMKVYRRFPGKAAGDSYTPRTMKIQLAAAAGALASLAAGLFFPPAVWLFPVLMLLFLGSTIPLALAVMGGDPLLALLAPVLLGLRALALLTGMVAGLLRFRPFLGGGES
jgi:glycosyltransferase involved in cell wall biosynthesis